MFLKMAGMAAWMMAEGFSSLVGSCVSPSRVCRSKEKAKMQALRAEIMHIFMLVRYEIEDASKKHHIYMQVMYTLLRYHKTMKLLIIILYHHLQVCILSNSAQN